MHGRAISSPSCMSLSARSGAMNLALMAALSCLVGTTRAVPVAAREHLEGDEALPAGGDSTVCATRLQHDTGWCATHPESCLVGTTQAVPIAMRGHLDGDDALLAGGHSTVCATRLRIHDATWCASHPFEAAAVSSCLDFGCTSLASHRPDSCVHRLERDPAYVQSTLDDLPGVLASSLSYDDQTVTVLVSVCVCARARECVSVCVGEREREREYATSRLWGCPKLSLPFSTPYSSRP